MTVGKQYLEVKNSLKNYIQDNLIYIYDAENNQGLGKYSKTASTWLPALGNDLDGRTRSKGDFIFNGKYSDFSGTKTDEFIKNKWLAITPAKYSLEIVCEPIIHDVSSYEQYEVEHGLIGLGWPSTSGITSVAVNSITQNLYLLIQTPRSVVPSNFHVNSNEPLYLCLLVSPNNGVSLYANGQKILQSSDTISTSWAAWAGDCFGSITGKGASKVYRFSRYSGWLTESEIFNNYQIDKYRFDI